MSKRDQVQLDEKEIIRLYLDEKLTIEDIRKIYNVNYATIKLRLTRNNIQLRSTSESKKIVMNRPEVKEKTSIASKKSAGKRKQTNLERYNSVVPASAPDIRKKWENKYIEKHGVSYGKDPNRLKRIEKTCLEKEGVKNGSQFQKSKEKIKNKRWKNKSNKELEIISNKTKTKWKNNLGVSNPLQNESVKNKMKKKRWLDKSKSELEEIKNKGKRTHKEKIIPIIFDKLKKLNLEIIGDYRSTTKPIVMNCLICGTHFETVLDYIFHDYGHCPKCFPKNISKWEQEVKEFLQNELGEVITIKYNYRKKLSCNKELDIYIPDKNVAIECNGIYYHSEKMSSEPKTYHLDKTIECKKLGIRLIHIFEDEWYNKKEIVIHRLLNILGIAKTKKLDARKCTIKEITTKEKSNFLKQYHLQGNDISNIKLGAFFKENLVAVMTFSKGNIAKGSKSKERVWELNRFATDYNYNVRGIAGKLLAYFKNNYEWKEIYSYADQRWSNGELYKILGFEQVKVTEPNYWYVKGMKRIHRFSLRKKPHEPKHITEWELRKNEGYTRIWDCGNIKFRMTAT